jgi:type III restriction enzyme
MADVTIENPILNSPFREPIKHFKFTDDGITNEIIEGRRISSYFIPIAQPRKKGKQLSFDTEWTQDRIEENKNVNRIRPRISVWREGGYVGVTPTTARLLEYWTNPEREKKLFFCQVEVLETAIYITEVAKKFGDTWIENSLREANDTSNPGLPRIAFKMATGSGKTVVMAMLIAWQTCEPAGCSIHRYLSSYRTRHHDSRPPASPLAERPRKLLSATRYHHWPSA